MGITGKKILLISPFFYPETISTGKYNTHLAKACRDSGAEVEVITSHPLYPAWRPTVSHGNIEGLVIRRGGGWIRYPKAPVVRRAVLEVWFMFHALFKTFSVRKKIDVVVPIFPPNLFFPILSRILPKSTMRIGIVHDLQGLLAVHSNQVGRKVISNLISFIEGRGFHACDRLVFLSNAMAEQAVKAYGLNKDKCLMCYPFVTPIPRNRNSSELLGLFPSDKYHIVYSGALGEKQNPYQLMDFLKRLITKRNDVCAHIFSSGHIFELLRKREMQFSDGRLFFHNLVPEENLWELYSRSSIQIVPQAPGTGDGAFPSKLPNLLIAGVPVLGICEKNSELAHILKESGGGHAVHTWDADIIVEQVGLYLQEVSSQSREDRQRRLQSYVEKKFDIKKVVDIILSSIIQKDS